MDRACEPDEALARRLGDRVAELIDVPSPSGSERALAAHLLGLLGPLAVDAGDDCILAGVTERDRRPLVLLAGHLDTVPAQDNLPSRRQQGVVHGLGASDMKGALAVMVELLLSGAQRRSRFDLGCVFFPREELPFGDSALTPLLARTPGLRTADLAIVMEPTAGRVQLGCLGNINATWTFSGTAGHSARPWQADNAIDRAAGAITELAGRGAIEHTFAGLVYREVVSAVTIAGGVARNVVPDSCVVEVNYRYPPGMSPEQGERTLRGLCEPQGGIEIDGNAPSGAVPAGNELVDLLIGCAGGGMPEPKQAWTPVAEFSLAGVDAVNFGPGDPAFAHRRDEQVSELALADAYRTIERLLGG